MNTPGKEPATCPSLLREILARLFTGKTWPVSFSVTLTDANTEYPYQFPPGTVSFSIQSRDATAFRCSWQTGAVAASQEPYATVQAGAPYSEIGLDSVADLRIYLASANAGTVIEGIAWSREKPQEGS